MIYIYTNSIYISKICLNALENDQLSDVYGNETTTQQNRKDCDYINYSINNDKCICILSVWEKISEKDTGLTLSLLFKSVMFSFNNSTFPNFFLSIRSFIWQSLNSLDHRPDRPDTCLMTLCYTNI